ncbi:hypothetical protein HDA40_007717 [Hamadaea flava]|uniref:Uncharacterized protein n=1 Tax=Hamadaea flava TaxID=1742688 RepID=A0ABV8LVT6_9ACTN|nr:hypothetical protein [Hamadaea flava]MCP2329210.1 hypothetical protein [Hamadaea flava]
MEVGRYFALLEESTGGKGQYANWKLTNLFDLGLEREAAVAGALQLARTYKPRHPWSDRGRRIFEHGLDSWVVIVEGATSSHHFRLSLTRLLAEQP